MEANQKEKQAAVTDDKRVEEMQCQIQAATEAGQRCHLVIAELLRKAKEPGHKSAILQAKAMIAFAEGLAQKHEALRKRCQRRSEEVKARKPISRCTQMECPEEPANLSKEPCTKNMDSVAGSWKAHRPAH